MTKVRRRGVLLLLSGGVAAAAAATAPSRSYAEGANSDGYQMVAAADGVRITWTVPNFAVVDSPIDGGGPSAQARLDSLGKSSAFASMPYPGDAFVGLPGLLAGFTGLPAVPAYPFYVHSSHPTVPDGKFEAPGASLTAHSDAGSSVASASGGSGGEALVSHPVSRAETTRAEDGTLTAVATSAIDAVVVGPLSLRGLVSTAKVVRTADGRQEITSSLAAASASVGGTAAELNDQGLVVAGTPTPLGAKPVTDALNQAGINVALAKAVKSDQGVVAPSLSITFSQYSELIQRQVTIRYVLGASSASVLGTAPPALLTSEVFGPGETTVGPPDAAAPVSEPLTSDGLSLGDGGGLSAVPGGPLQTGGATAAGSGDGAALPATRASRPAGTGAAPVGTGAGRRFSPVVSESAGWAWGSLYLVLVAAGLVLAGGAELIRSLGVRKP